MDEDWRPVKDMRINDMTNKQIKDHYYSLIYQSRRLFHEKQRLESFLDNPLLMCCFMTLWLLIAITLLFFIWAIPDLGIDLLLLGGIPLSVLHFITYLVKRNRKDKLRLLNRVDYEIKTFRRDIEKARREVPDYPFLDTEVHYLDFDYIGTVPGDDVRE